jgi:uncharacterized protein (UPF0212 family)
MHPLSAWELLDVWERGLAQPPVQRVLTLLAAADPEAPPDALAALSIGQRDARLLTLREWTFGPQLVSLATCPGCSERLELTFNVADIRVPSPSQGEGWEGVETLSLSAASHEVRFRLPNSLDLAAIAEHEDVTATRRLLLERCLLGAQHDGEEVALDQLPDGVIDALVKRMGQADPQADVQLDLSCPACGHQWQAAFDIASFFWSEINAWAYRILREVYILASAYGWREADILAMSPWRRQLYLEMVSA